MSLELESNLSWIKTSFFEFSVDCIYFACPNTFSILTLPGVMRNVIFTDSTNRCNNGGWGLVGWEGFKPSLRYGTSEMQHSRGISPSDLFIHFLQRGNLTHDLIHLCDVCGNAGCPCVTRAAYFRPADKYPQPEVCDCRGADERRGSEEEKEGGRY